MPALTAFYGLRPWEIELFSMDEIDQYLSQLEDYEQQARARREE